MHRWKLRYAASAATACLCLFLEGASASFGQGLNAAVRYTETPLSGGLWQYQYTVYNLLDGTTTPGRNIFDLSLDFSSSTAVTVEQAPFGWDYLLDQGQVEFFATNVGAPPVGSEIPPSSSLGGFQITLDYKAGDIPFTATAADPGAPNNPFTVQGVARSVLSVAAPEPGTLAIFALTGCSSCLLTCLASRCRK